MSVNGFPPPVSDEELHAFVDGETAPERRDAILAFLSASPADAARVETWRRQNETIRAAFARVETEHVPLSWSLSAASRRRGFPCKLLSGRERSETSAIEADPSSLRLRRALAGFVIAGVASGVIAAIVAPLIVERLTAPNPAPFIRVGRAHPPADTDAAFANRTVSALLAFAPPAATTSAPPQGGETALADGQTGLILPNLFGKGLKLTGVRVAPNESDQTFCLFYATAANAAVALCVEKAAGTGAAGFRKTGHFPSATISWRQRGAKYAIAGAMTEIELRNLAERAHSEVEAFAIR
jgi:anti-sigma factor RsiW